MTLAYLGASANPAFILNELRYFYSWKIEQNCSVSDKNNSLKFVNKTHRKYKNDSDRTGKNFDDLARKRNEISKSLKQQESRAFAGNEKTQYRHI